LSTPGSSSTKQFIKQTQLFTKIELDWINKSLLLEPREAFFAENEQQHFSELFNISRALLKTNFSIM